MYKTPLASSETLISAEDSWILCNILASSSFCLSSSEILCAAENDGKQLVDDHTLILQENILKNR